MVAVVSLRWYYPDQVQRVLSQAETATPATQFFVWFKSMEYICECQVKILAHYSPRLSLINTTRVLPLGNDFSVIVQVLQIRPGLLHSSQ